MLVIIDSYNNSDNNNPAVCWLCSVLSYFADSFKKFVCLIGTKCTATNLGIAPLDYKIWLFYM